MKKQKLISHWVKSRGLVSKPLVFGVLILVAGNSCSPLTDVPEPLSSEVQLYKPEDMLKTPEYTENRHSSIDLSQYFRNNIFEINGEILAPETMENCDHLLKAENGQLYDLTEVPARMQLSPGSFVSLLVKKENELYTKCQRGIAVEALRLLRIHK